MFNNNNIFNKCNLLFLKSVKYFPIIPSRKREKSDNYRHSRNHVIAILSISLGIPPSSVDIPQKVARTNLKVVSLNSLLFLFHFSEDILCFIIDFSERLELKKSHGLSSITSRSLIFSSFLAVYFIWKMKNVIA